MKLHVIGTGSSGNCYLLESGNRSLILEAGLPIKKIMKGLPSGFHGVEGCLITHEHMDHAKEVKTLTEHYGIATYMSRGTAGALYRGRNLPHSIRVVKHGQMWSTGRFILMAFNVIHDVREPLGFLIYDSETKERALYATDTCRLPNKYPRITYWLIECNYVDELAENLLETANGYALYERLMKSHMSLSRLKKELESNDLTQTKDIVLLHMSKDRGDPVRMAREIHECSGIKTTVANSGSTIYLGECPF